MRQEVEKQAIEKMVLEEFARAVRLPLSRFESKAPPEPDLLCLLGRDAMHFELMSVTDPIFERAFAAWRRSEDPGWGAGPIHPWDCLPAKLSQKLRKRYEITPGARLDLLLYFDKGPERDPVSKLEAQKAEFEAAFLDSQFERIWVFDRSYGVVGVIRREKPPLLVADACYPSRGFAISALPAAWRD